MLRVLKLPRTEPIVWQRALLEVEVEQALAELAGGRAGADVVASAAVRATYQQLTAGGAGGSGSGGGVAAAAASVRRAIEGDCPVCCEELEPAGEALVFCGSCGNNIHRLCFDKWAAQGRRQGGGSGVTCVMCRAPWVDGASGKAAADSGSAGAVAAVAAVPGLGPGGYLNLAAVSDAHRGAQAASLEALYGDRSVWIQANQGRIGRREAASLWAASGHY